MLVLAAISVVAAVIYYPWPEFAVVDEEVGKPLFELYEAKDIRGIDIIQFNSDKSTLDRIKLNRRGEKWVIPAKQNFVATESLRIGFAIDCLNDKVVYDVMSENQQDHIKFGVVDPTEYTAEQNVASLGKKLTLTDRNNQTVADIIVGAALKNDSAKRYVRIPGKPRVYVVDFDASVLSTNFMNWVSPNVLNLQAQKDVPGRQIFEFKIDNYRITKDQNSKAKRASVYRAGISPSAGKLNVRFLQVPDGDDWKTLNLTPEQQVRLTNAVPYLLRLFIDDARKAPEEISDAIQDPEFRTAGALAKLPNYGFFDAGTDAENLKFESTNGQVHVTTTDGVKTTISIGQVGSENTEGSGKLNYYAMVNSSIDNTFLKKPTRPSGVENDESDENKAYLRKVEQWNNAVEKAEQRAAELNAVNADWFYLISEDIIEQLRPDIPLPEIQSSAPSPPAETGTKPENDNNGAAEIESVKNDSAADDK